MANGSSVWRWGVLLIAGAALPWMIGAILMWTGATKVFWLKLSDSPSPHMLVLGAALFVVAISLYESVLSRIAKKSIALHSTSGDSTQVDRTLRLDMLMDASTNVELDEELAKIESDVVNNVAPSLDGAVKAFESAIETVVTTTQTRSGKADLRNDLRRAAGGPTGKAEGYFDRLTFALDRYQSRIGEEYTDISSRTGWLMTSQAFLIASLATVLNSTQLAEPVRFWVSLAVAFTGSVFTLVLVLSLFHGHALMERLKEYRDAIEAKVSTEFGLPPAGVDRKAFAHIFGHSATKFLPVFAYTGWVAITIGLAHGFHATQADSNLNVVLWPTGEALPFATGGLSATQSSPPFAIGSSDYADKTTDDRCPVDKEAVDQWKKKMVARWIGRRAASENDSIILIGGADRLPLSPSMSRKYDENVGLARRRAETVKQLLISETAKLDKQHQLTEERFVVLVTVPKPEIRPPDHNRHRLCKDTAMTKDRTVRILLPGQVL